MVAAVPPRPLAVKEYSDPGATIRRLNCPTEELTRSTTTVAAR